MRTAPLAQLFLTFVTLPLVFAGEIQDQFERDVLVASDAQELQYSEVAGSWVIQDGTVLAEGDSGKLLLIDRPAITGEAFTISVDLKFEDPTVVNCGGGLCLGYIDAKNYQSVRFRGGDGQGDGAIQMTIEANGRNNLQSVPLQGALESEVWYRLKVESGGGRYSVTLAKQDTPENYLTEAQFKAPTAISEGKWGFIASTPTRVAFDNLVIKTE